MLEKRYFYEKEFLGILSVVLVSSVLVACNPSQPTPGSSADTSGNVTPGDDDTNSYNPSIDSNFTVSDSTHEELTTEQKDTSTTAPWAAPEGTTADTSLHAQSYAGASYEEKGKILSQLEKWAIDNHITGIPFLDNTSYVMYSNRVTGLFEKEIPNFGWGLSYASITEPLSTNIEPNTAYSKYLHLSSPDLPAVLNIWNADDNTTSSLMDYIQSEYYTTAPNTDKTGYIWKPSLAKSLPIALNLNNDGLASKWRIELRTDPTYSTLSTKYPTYNGRHVALEDYLTPFITTLLGSNKQYRASDLSKPESGGIVNADKFTKDTANLDQIKDKDQILKLWKDDNVGVTPFQSVDADGTVHWYLDFNLLQPVNKFNAIYRLSSSIYSPIPYDFLKDIRTDEKKTAADSYGQDFDTTLSLGVYTLEEWQANKTMVFKKNTSYFDSDNYNLEGVHYTLDSGNTEEKFNKFLNGVYDTAGVPSSKLSQYSTQAKKSSGDTAFPIQTLATTPEVWEKLFGPNGIVKAHQSKVDWSSKVADTNINASNLFIPANRYWMSNSDFWEGLYYSIDRQSIATAKGKGPSQAPLSDAYMIDPENGISWRNSDDGKAVLADRLPESYGYSVTRAADYFGKAADAVTSLANSPWKDGDTIKLQFQWAGTSIKSMIGEDFINQIIQAWNQSKAKTQHNITLQIETHTWDDNDWQTALAFSSNGEVDLLFGAGSSGNILDPLSFMSVYKSDNSSGLTNSFSVDTSVPSTTNPITYDGKTWSYDALYSASSTGTAIDQSGNIVSLFTVDDSKIKLDGKKVSGSFNYTVRTVENASVTFDGVTLYISVNGGAASGSVDLASNPVVSKPTISADKHSQTFTVSFDSVESDYFAMMQTTDIYDFEIHYTLTINGFSVSTYTDVVLPFTA